MDRGQYFFAEQHGKTIIKMKGNLKYTFSSGFDLFLEKLLQKDFGDLLFDLTEAVYIDSTNLGLIAGIANKVKKQGGGKVAIVANSEIYYILVSVGFHRVFTILGSQVQPDDLIEIPGVPQNEKEKARMLLKAHKALMDMDDKNHSMFKDVVEMLENEVNG